MLENLVDSFNNEVKGKNETKHHKNTASFEKMFQKDSEPLKKEFSRVGNPFEDDSEQMHNIVSRNIMDKITLPVSIQCQMSQTGTVPSVHNRRFSSWKEKHL